MQERVPRDSLYPWRVLVLCALLNRTGRKQVRPMFEALFERYPTPRSLARAGAPLDRMLRPLGLGDRRAALLKQLSCDYDSGVPPRDCHGAGRYARDALSIFVDGDLDVRSDDGFLSRYVTWKRRQMCLGRRRGRDTR